MDVRVTPGIMALLLTFAMLLGAAAATLAEERRIGIMFDQKIAAEVAMHESVKLTEQATLRANNAFDRVTEDKAIVEECTSQLDHLRRSEEAFK